MTDDDNWMVAALDEAGRALEHDDVPIGCVVVDRDGRELARAHNAREDQRDPTAHAELVAIRGAAGKLGTWRLEGTTVYVTLEPCPMCAGAMVLARVARLVFGATDPKAGATGSLYNIVQDERLNHRLSVSGGVRAEESAAMLQSFFREKRDRSRPI